MCRHPDFWLLVSSVAGRGTWLFSFCSICGWRSQAFPCARFECWLCSLHLWLCMRIFYSSPQLLPATSLPCHFFSCDSISVTVAVGTALPTPPASLWGTGLLRVGHVKKAAGMRARICPSLSATHQNRCEQCVSVWCLGTSFLHLPGKAERTTPALFSPGESENYSPQHCTCQSGFISVWLNWAYNNIGGEGESKLLCFQHGVAMLRGGCPCPEPSSGFPSAAGSDRDFWHGVGTSPSAPSGDCFVPSVSSWRHQ